MFGKVDSSGNIQPIAMRQKSTYQTNSGSEDRYIPKNGSNQATQYKSINISTYINGAGTAVGDSNSLFYVPGLVKRSGTGGNYYIAEQWLSHAEMMYISPNTAVVFLTYSVRLTGDSGCKWTCFDMNWPSQPFGWTFHATLWQNLYPYGDDAEYVTDGYTFGNYGDVWAYGATIYTLSAAWVITR